MIRIFQMVFEWQYVSKVWVRAVFNCRKTKTKAITPTNHNGNEKRDEPITIPSNHL